MEHHLLTVLYQLLCIESPEHEQHRPDTGWMITTHAYLASILLGEMVQPLH